MATIDSSRAFAQQTAAAVASRFVDFVLNPQNPSHHTGKLTFLAELASVIEGAILDKGRFHLEWRALDGSDPNRNMIWKGGVCFMMACCTAQIFPSDLQYPDFGQGRAWMIEGGNVDEIRCVDSERVVVPVMRNGQCVAPPEPIASVLTAVAQAGLDGRSRGATVGGRPASLLPQ